MVFREYDDEHKANEAHQSPIHRSKVRNSANGTHSSAHYLL